MGSHYDLVANLLLKK